jgi:hypothetical protein
MLVNIMIVYFCVYAEMCKLNTQHANKLVATEMVFWKRSAITSRKEEFWNDTVRETMAVGKKILWVIGKQLWLLAHVKKMTRKWSTTHNPRMGNKGMGHARKKGGWGKTLTMGWKKIEQAWECGETQFWMKENHCALYKSLDKWMNFCVITVCTFVSGYCDVGGACCLCVLACW